jgi:hypothetical protein
MFRFGYKDATDLIKRVITNMLQMFLAPSATNVTTKDLTYVYTISVYHR